MNKLLLAAPLVTLSFAAHAQNWGNPLPVDSASGYIVYRGRFVATNQTQAQALARAARYARTQLTGPYLVDSSKVGAPVVSGSGERSFTWKGGPAGTGGRTLHYELLLRPKAGYYEYEVGDLANETPAVQMVVQPGAAVTIAPKKAGVEAILRNPTSYDKKHRPTPALRSYCEAVNEAVQAVLSDAKAALGAR
jgi:hypothetical protein